MFAPPVYQPNNFGHTIVALVFYIIMAGIALYSLIALYALLRYGRNRLLGMIVAIAYLVIWAGLFASAASTLSTLSF
jgi:hypothetical protein